MTDDPDVEVLQRHTLGAVAAAIDNDTRRCTRAILAIAEMGPVAVHAALVGWSTISLAAFEDNQDTTQPGSFWGLEVLDSRTGQPASIDAIGDPATRDAARLVACTGNQDHATIAAIIVATEEDMEALVKLMYQSVRIAAVVARDLYDQDTGGAS